MSQPAFSCSKTARPNPGLSRNFPAILWPWFVFFDNFFLLNQNANPGDDFTRFSGERAKGPLVWRVAGNTVCYLCQRFFVTDAFEPFLSNNAYRPLSCSCDLGSCPSAAEVRARGGTIRLRRCYVRSPVSSRSWDQTARCLFPLKVLTEWRAARKQGKRNWKACWKITWAAAVLAGLDWIDFVLYIVFWFFIRIVCYNEVSPISYSKLKDRQLNVVVIHSPIHLFNHPFIPVTTNLFNRVTIAAHKLIFTLKPRSVVVQHSQ